jgi:hypothetical protein
MNPMISTLWTVVETYENVPFNAILQRRGNAALSREHVAARIDKSRAPVFGLPRNWYNEDWYRNLESYEQKQLAAKPDEPIPKLVRRRLLMCSPAYILKCRLQRFIVDS